MTITTRDQLIAALGNNSSRVVIDKASIASTVAGQTHSLWRALGVPGQGAIPAGALVPTYLTTGAINFVQQTVPATSYLAQLFMGGSNSATTNEIHDRLCHMGGLSGTLTTAQTVGIDLSTLLASNNLDARKGANDFSDVQFFLEWYTDTGATVATATVNVTYNDGTTGNLTGISLAATRRASFMVALNLYIPAAASGKFIRGVNTVTLSATTGTAGSFGVTATRLRAVVPVLLANKAEVYDWAQLGLPEVVNESCLFLIQVASTTTTGTLRGGGKVAHG